MSRATNLAAQRHESIKHLYDNHGSSEQARYYLGELEKLLLNRDDYPVIIRTVEDCRKMVEEMKEREKAFGSEPKSPGTDVEFVMTYPCYVLNTKEGNPESVKVDGTVCLCLFTDKDLVERFYREKYGPDASPTIEATVVDRQENLITLLQEWKRPSLAQGCGSVAIDPSAGRSCYVEFDELIKELKRQNGIT